MERVESHGIEDGDVEQQIPREIISIPIEKGEKEDLAINYFYPCDGYPQYFRQWIETLLEDASHLLFTFIIKGLVGEHRLIEMTRMENGVWSGSSLFHALKKQCARCCTERVVEY